MREYEEVEKTSGGGGPWKVIAVISIGVAVLASYALKMVRPTLEELGKSPEIIRTAKDQAVVSVRQLLESALDAAGTGVRVKPYFRSEGKPPAPEKK